MKKHGRWPLAAQRAAPPSVLTGTIMAFVVAGHAVRGDGDLVVGAVVGAALTLIVFATFFVVGLAGYRVRGDFVGIRARYAWPLIGVVTTIVMATAFYLMSRFGK